MPPPIKIFSCHVIYLALLTLCALVSTSVAQQNPPDNQADDVLRVNTELVQTGVTVFDKQDKFVEGLKPEQFEIKVDGKPVQVSFFERVVAGTANEERLIAAAGKAANSSPASATAPDATRVRGRTIIFFIDDLHLSADSVNRTRKAILEFVENQMGASDQVAIASTSGQIGFLQQFTDNKAVLRAAVACLNHKPYNVPDSENIPMTEYTALKIDQGDKDALDYYVQETLKANSYSSPGGGMGPGNQSPFGGKTQKQMAGMTGEMAANQVKERAQAILKQAAAVTISTLTTLESLMRSSSQLLGRKVVFFISDGFYLNDRNTAFGDKLKQITDAANRAGIVIYTMDARGLVSMTDAGSNRADPLGRMGRSNLGEITASQDALTAMASDTGGRFFNSGALLPAVSDALKETSNYYLLAWRPDAEDQKGGKFKRIDVSINGRPDLSVRMARGFLAGDSRTNARSMEAKTSTPDAKANAAKGPEADIRTALTASAPKKGLPTQLSTSFVDVPGSGTVLTASAQMATDVLDYGADGKQPAGIDLAGVVLDDQGKQVGGFKTHINVNPLSANQVIENPGVIYSNKVPLKPGIYQVRVAARDERSGRVGSATQWIEIPDLSTRRLTLSSLLVGGQFVGSTQKQGSGGAAQEQVLFSVDRRFAHGSHLNFLTIIYNAAHTSNGAPDLEAQIQITHGPETIVNSPARKITLEANGDPARIPYGADIGLKTLPAGRYLLKVTITDRNSNASASQQVAFDIE